MILRNYTPFPPLLFDGRDVQGHDFGVLVLRGTFDIIPGAALRPNPKQEPVVVADVWYGEPNVSSIRLDSDLAPFKPRTDVVVNATAFAPGGRALPSWETRVRVGDLDKRLRVTGPRAWVREGRNWTLEEPQAVLEVPMRYEYAFGGMYETNWGDSKVCLENPVGKGFVEGDVPDHFDRWPAPQIESLQDPVIELGKRYVPEGFGVIARSWQPRLGRAGKFDDEWQKTRWPELPLDFDFAFYNAAHDDLVVPGYLRGDEEVELEGLTPEGSLRFYLPGYKLGILLRYKDGSMAVARVLLDTVFLDAPEMKAYLTWRSVMPKGKPIRVIESRLLRARGSGTHG
jgi:hypothetical protein